MEMKLIQSYQDHKLRKRKNLMNNYTFKKTRKDSSMKPKTSNAENAEDFHVEGWNLNTEVDRKDAILIM